MRLSLFLIHCLLFVNFNLYSQCDNPIEVDYEVICILEETPVYVIAFTISGGSGVYNIPNGDFIGNDLIEGTIYEIIRESLDVIFDLEIYDANEEDNECLPLFFNEIFEQPPCPDPLCPNFGLGHTTFCSQEMDNLFYVLIHIFGGVKPFHVMDTIIYENTITLGPFLQEDQFHIVVSDSLLCKDSIFVGGIPCPIFPNLAIELLSFTGKKNEDKTKLIEWSTASEVDNEYFILESSADGRSFNVLEKIDSKGASTTVQQYKVFTNTEHNYFRLKANDIFGKSEIVSDVIYSEDQYNDIKVFISHSDRLSISFNEVITDKINTRIVNSSGHIMMNSIFQNTNKIDLDISNLPTGIYFIDCISSTKQFKSKFYLK